ncbi:hypothetical protein D5H75_17560 [Bailinhaonella thermotolerans]|uniref:DUF8017 domain-containing protein n=2 Tax=Bailinhaonella thermotolerans TaxID=1070861 RepID=A0A3A4AXS1_9ACTN|nr:hypothetical protein D5H75_17560 [Bailinhaonella thermotolerans]
MPGQPTVPGTTRPRRERNNAMIIAFTLVGALVLTAGALGFVVLGNDGDKDPDPGKALPQLIDTPAPAQTAGPATSPTAAGSPPPIPTPNPPPPMKPTVAGWQAVFSTKRQMAYDVPSRWQVRTPTTIIGFEDADGKPLVGMSGAAKLYKGKCGGEDRSLGGAGVQEADSNDSAAVARFFAGLWADAAYRTEDDERPQVTLGPPKPIKLDGRKGRVVTATAVRARSEKCEPPRGQVYVAAIPKAEGDGNVVLIIYAHRGVADSIPEYEINKIISTFRDATT